MNKIRVLVVDDAVVVRRMVSDALASDPVLEVVGTAANGKIALAKIPQVNPDLVTLDVEMPEMNGLETLAAIKKLYPKLPVVMFSTLTECGALTTIEALSLGANDYVTKPSNVGSVAQAQQSLRDELIPKIKALCAKRVDIPPAVKTSPPAYSCSVPSRPSNIEVVAIGVSTGGPNALCEILPAIPADFPVPIVIVQHMPPMFTKLLAERLDKQCQIDVFEGADDDPVRPGCAYIAPGDFHMVVKREALRTKLLLDKGTPENSCRPAVDVMFRSVVQVYGAGTLGVILTGMGQDGLRGCEQIRSANGQIIAQDEKSSVVWGMPGFVVRAGIADNVLPIHQIAGEIIRRVSKGRNGTSTKRVATCS